MPAPDTRTYAARMMARHGYRRSTARPCPRVVAGLRCLAFRAHGRPCVCQMFYPQPLDHARIWLDRGGRHVLTSEPYHLEPDLQATFECALAALGLTVRISAEGAEWYPGSTMLVTVTRPA